MTLMQIKKVHKEKNNEEDLKQIMFTSLKKNDNHKIVIK